MLRSASVVSLAVMIFLSGCQVSTKPKMVASAAPDNKLKVREAPFHGEYQLFQAQSDRETGRTQMIGEPLATQRLRRGESLRFRRESDQLHAIAGAESIPLETGRYAWQMRADAGQTDGSKTVAFVVLVGVVTAAVLQVAFVASF